MKKWNKEHFVNLNIGSDRMQFGKVIKHLKENVLKHLKENHKYYKSVLICLPILILFLAFLEYITNINLFRFLPSGFKESVFKLSILLFVVASIEYLFLNFTSIIQEHMAILVIVSIVVSLVEIETKNFLSAITLIFLSAVTLILYSQLVLWENEYEKKKQTDKQKKEIRQKYERDLKNKIPHLKEIKDALKINEWQAAFLSI